MRLKSNSPTEAIVVSFHARWHTAFIDNPPLVVFRLRVPKVQIKKMLLYLKAPVAAIIGYAEVTSVEQMTKSKAMTLVDRSGLSANELQQYIANQDMVGAFHLGETAMFSAPVPLDRLKTRFDFFPPQSFSYINLTVSQELERSFRN